MIHTKLLIRRLAYVPWLLAFGLMLSWAGEAQADEVRLTVDKKSVREDAGATEITVTATNYGADDAKKKVGADRYVILDLDPDQKGLNERFRLSLSTIIIPKDKDAGTATITLTPIDLKEDHDGDAKTDMVSAVGNAGTDDDAYWSDAPNLLIEIFGEAGAVDVKKATVVLIDKDQITDRIYLSVSPGEISQESGPTEITVTATVDGKTVNSKSLSFPLLVVSGDKFTATSSTLDVPKPKDDAIEATRDTDYTITSLGSITIPRKKVKGTATFTIDPKTGPRWVGIGTRYTGTTTATDLKYNADGGSAKDARKGAKGLSKEVAATDSTEEQGISVIPALLSISEKKIAALKGDNKGFVATPNSIREDAGTTEISLKITLENALTKDEAVKFSVKEETGGALRDVNYTAVFTDLTILAGSTEGTAMLTLTPFNNGGTNDPKVITVRAEVGKQSTQDVKVTITDDDTQSLNIKLSASPADIKEDAGETDVTITATLDGKVFDEDKKLTLVLDSADAKATRDVDFTAIIRSLTIKAGEVSGSTTISITPVDDGLDEDDDEPFYVKSVTEIKNDDDDKLNVGSKMGEDDDLVDNRAKITLKDTGAKAAPGDPEDSTPKFTGGDIAASDTAIEGTAGKALEDVVLPAATGDGKLTYSVSANLPAGLSFDVATRTISGTPLVAGTSSIIYTVIDGDTGDQLPAESAALTYTVEIAAMPAPTVAVASVASTRSSVRENGETVSITLTATLRSPAPKAEEILFTVVAGTEGAMAVRDVDYTASLVGGVAIAEGATEASTTLVLMPLDNGVADGHKYLTVQASGSGGSASTMIKIADDETASTSISLSASPHSVSEDAGVTEVTITATLDGKVLDANAIVTVSVDPASAATRDEDYSALFNPRLEIPAGSVSGSITFLIDPIVDDLDEDNEAIKLRGAIAGLVDGVGVVLIDDVAVAPAGPSLAFAEGTMVDDISITASWTMKSLVLPEASGGSGDVAYTVSELPAGLLFDPATRTISGTPEAAGTTEVTYTATDSAGSSVPLSFSITVNAQLEFGDLSGLFGAFLNLGAGKANPASEHDAEAIPFVVGEPVSLTLPEVSGGTPPLSYSVSGLPAGLSFDPSTRTVSGTPTQVSDVVVVTYTVADGSGASKSLPISVVVVAPSLDAPDALVAVDYKGADGAGDQGGFVLLTWDLSDDHDTLDGYRIFRELPVLNSEMVPWAMVDAVPGVEMGRAIVATLDNVATNWGIAAERGGQTTHGAAKAVFVSSESLSHPYAVMAQTLAASKEAAHVGDAPVFASLLPEALAYAQGVTPKLNVVAGELERSALTVTEEPVRAIDNIAPLAVPSLTVLDAPNDQGSRILLTWMLSPSDQLLQGVVAGAIGPAAVERVVGVHGYGIYRRAAGEDEFALLAQVDAGVTSFVDETVLNGVRYTYQVRPYDLDNETASDAEQTAMAVRNGVLDSEGRAIFGLFGADNRIGFDDFFLFADHFGLTAEDAGFDPAFDLAPSATIDFDDFFVFADHFGRSTVGAGKRIPLIAGLNADARMYLDARTAMPNVGEDFVLDVRVADFVAVKGYGLQVQYDASKLEFVQTLTEQPLGGSELAAPQVLSDEGGLLALVAHGDIVSEGEVELSLVFRAKTEIENTVIEITDTQTYDSEFGFNRLALPAPVQLQTRPELFALANNYPNPFNPATTIKYALPQASDVELTVYNVVGQAVRTLVAEHQSAGRYVVEWDATNDSGHSLSSGLYFYHLQAGGGEFREVKKMLLLK